MADITQNSKTTPFSGENIDTVNARGWESMSRTDLEQERYKLQMRLQSAGYLNNPHINATIIQGIDQLTNLINAKLNA